MTKDEIAHPLDTSEEALEDVVTDAALAEEFSLETDAAELTLLAEGELAAAAA
jgi:hypothetical protein